MKDVFQGCTYGFALTGAIACALALFVHPPLKQPEPECWSRVAADGRVLEVHGGKACHWRDPRHAPVVKFNYAPLSKSEHDAYEVSK